MQIETGAFGGHVLSDGFLPAARVVIPAREFARLGLGDHEHPDRAWFRISHFWVTRARAESAGL